MSKGYVEGEVIANLVEDCDCTDLEKRIVQRGGVVADRINIVPMWVITTTPGEEQAWIDWLKEQPEVDSAELNITMTLC